MSLQFGDRCGAVTPLVLLLTLIVLLTSFFAIVPDYKRIREGIAVIEVAEQLNALQQASQYLDDYNIDSNAVLSIELLDDIITKNNANFARRNVRTVERNRELLKENEQLIRDSNISCTIDSAPLIKDDEGLVPFSREMVAELNKEVREYNNSVVTANEQINKVNLEHSSLNLTRCISKYEFMQHPVWPDCVQLSTISFDNRDDFSVDILVHGNVRRVYSSEILTRSRR